MDHLALLNIGEAARFTGRSIPGLRLLELRGELKCTRSTGNYRQYRVEDLLPHRRGKKAVAAPLAPLEPVSRESVLQRLQRILDTAEREGDHVIAVAASRVLLEHLPDGAGLPIVTVEGHAALPPWLSAGASKPDLELTLKDKCSSHSSEGSDVEP